jgi:hypothetical protein
MIVTACILTQNLFPSPPPFRKTPGGKGDKYNYTTNNYQERCVKDYYCVFIIADIGEERWKKMLTIYDCCSLLVEMCYILFAPLASIV